MKKKSLLTEDGAEFIVNCGNRHFLPIQGQRETLIDVEDTKKASHGMKDGKYRGLGSTCETPTGNPPCNVDNSYKWVFKW